MDASEKENYAELLLAEETKNKQLRAAVSRLKEELKEYRAAFGNQGLLQKAEAELTCANEMCGGLQENIVKLRAENERLQLKRDEYHDQYHLCEAKLLSHKSIIKQGQVAYEQLRGLAQKIVLCFPDIIPEGQEEVAFNIPAYIVEELKQTLKKGE